MAVLNNNCIATLYTTGKLPQKCSYNVCLLELCEGLFQTGLIQYLNVLCLDLCLLSRATVWPSENVAIFRLSCIKLCSLKDEKLIFEK